MPTKQQSGDQRDERNKKLIEQYAKAVMKTKRYKQNVRKAPPF